MLMSLQVAMCFQQQWQTIQSSGWLVLHALLISTATQTHHLMQRWYFQMVFNTLHTIEGNLEFLHLPQESHCAIVTVATLLETHCQESTLVDLWSAVQAESVRQALESTLTTTVSLIPPFIHHRHIQAAFINNKYP